MRRTGGRLSLSDAMARQPQLDPIPHQETQSSNLIKAEREIKHLKLENQKLKAELTDIRSLYNQLIQENSHEKFDERRITVLKSQIIQLERQLLLYNEALTSRTETLCDIENNLQWLANKCRSFISKEVGGPRVPVERSELILMVETAESARIKLYKQIENGTKESLSRPLKFYSEFLQCSENRDVTLLEVAQGQLDHLNLKHVAKLETKLSSLYRNLIQLHATMETESSNDSAYLWTSCHMTTAVRERLMTQTLKCCALLKDCNSDLLDLSLLFPSAPWPPLKRCAMKEITAEKVLGCIPAKSRSKSEDLNKLIHALIKAYNYKIYMLQNQSKCLREEVKYHKKVYNLQLKYTESLFQAIREAYTSFEESSNTLIVKPLNVVLEAYLDLSQSASEVSLKKFIQTFKEQVPHLSNIVETLEVKDHQESEGSKVLSHFGEEFFKSLESLVQCEQKRRDLESTRIQDIQDEQARLDQELRDILEEQENRMQECAVTSLMTSSHDTTTDRTQVDDTACSAGNQVIPENSLGKKMTSCEKNVNESFKNTLRGSEPAEKRKPLHKKEWVGVLDDPESIFSPDLCMESRSHNETDETDRHCGNKGDRDSDINEVVEKEFSKLNLDSSETMNEMSDAALFSFHSKYDQQELVLVEKGDNHSVNKPGNTKDNCTQSQGRKTKNKRNYVPNTFVPNRTLQLRRSGSQTRLANQDCNKQGFEPAENKLEGVSVSIAENKNLSQNSERTRSKSLPKSRPAFR